MDRSMHLNLSKPGDKLNKLALNLKKNEKFKVKAAWDGDTDLDLHALFCVNHGDGAKASSMDDILSTYNVRRRIAGQEVGTLDKAADGTFSIHQGALVHSKDADDGDALDIDEWITIDPGKIAPVANAVVEIPLVVMIHQKTSSRTFRDVKDAEVVVENSTGEVLLRVRLSSQFGQFVGVQMGSIILEPTGAQFAAVGSGFQGDFNTVLEHFS
jgi:tellurium resistance protein TerD